MDVERLRTRRGRARPGRVATVALLTGLAGCTSVFGPTTAMSFMKQIDTSPDPNVRYKAYQSLASDRAYDSPDQKARAAGFLVEKLDPSKEPLASRAVICRTLGWIGDPVARPAMVRLVRDPDPLIRAEAYRALGKVGEMKDSTVLMQAMTLDTDDNCKAAAVEALGSLKQVDPRTEGYLVRAMDSDDPRIRYAALSSLRKISGQDLGVKAEPWRKYVLARYGDKIDPPLADARPPSPPVDPATTTASTMPRQGDDPAPPAPRWALNQANASASNGPNAPMPRPGAPTSNSADPSTPLPTPPGTNAPKGIFSKVFGY